jgi:hypothetical protein
MRPPWIYAAEELDRNGKRDKALDMLFQHVDELFHKGSFSEVNSILAEVDATKISVTLMLGYLSITYAANSQLSEYPKLLVRVEKELFERGEPVDKLLQGLKRTT